MEAIKKLHKDLWIASFFILVASIYEMMYHNIKLFVVCTSLATLFWMSKFYVQNKIIFPGSKANAATIIRLGALMITTACSDKLSLLHLGMIYSIICCGDILDGYLARVFNQISILGEYLDKETDALFVLCLSLLLHRYGVAGSWVVLLGLFRYLYFLPAYWFLDSNSKEVKDPWARVIAVYVFIALCSGFILPQSMSGPLLKIALLLLIYSFGKSFIAALHGANK